MSTSPKTLAERIALLMARSGIKSREKLALEMGYSRTQLHAVETGATVPTDRFMEKLGELERLAGLISAGEQKDRSARVAETPGELPSGTVARSDAEIAGLAALVNLHTAQVNAGVKKGDLPIVRRALEMALEARGVLPKTNE